MKKVQKIMFGALIIFIGVFGRKTNVNAYANAGGGITTGGVGGDCRISAMCNYNNGNFFALRATLVYIDNGTIKEIYPSYYFVNDPNNYLISNVKLNKKFIYSASDWGGSSIQVSDNKRYQKASAKLKEYFDDKKEDLSDSEATNVHLRNFIVKSMQEKHGKSGNYSSWKKIRDNVMKKKESQIANKKTAATKGWRILIEPVMNYTYTGNKSRLWSPKEYIQYFGVDNYNKSLNVNGYKKSGQWFISIQNVRPLYNNNTAQIQYLFTEFDDVGVAASVNNGKEETRRKKCATGITSWKTLGAEIDKNGKIKSGCGLNIYDVGASVVNVCKKVDNKYYCKDGKTCNETTYKEECENITTCHDIKIVKDSINCTDNKNSDATQNSGSLEETIEKVECKKDSDLYKKNYESGTANSKKANVGLSEYGTLVATNNHCSLYVREKDTMYLPAAYKGVVRPGGSFAWPSKMNDSSSGYKLRLVTQFIFRVVNEKGYSGKCTSNVKKALFNKGVDYAGSNVVYSAKLTAGDNQRINGVALVQAKTTGVGNRVQYKAGSNALSTDKSAVLSQFANEASSFRVVTSKYLEIPENKNRYVSNITPYKAQDTKSGLKDFTDRKQGVVSLLYNTSIGKKELTLNDIKVGKNGKYSITKYACPYEVTKEPECWCLTSKGSEIGDINVTDSWKASNYTSCDEYVEKTQVCKIPNCTEYNYEVYDGTEWVKKSVKKEVNIKACVQEKMKTKDYSTALSECTKEKCNEHTCRNTGASVPQTKWDQCMAIDGNTETECYNELCNPTYCDYIDRETGKIEQRDMSACLANEEYTKAQCEQSICGNPCKKCLECTWNVKKNKNEIIIEPTGDCEDTTTITITESEFECVRDALNSNLIKTETVTKITTITDLQTLLTNKEGSVSVNDIKTKLDVCRNPEGKTSITDALTFKSFDPNNAFVTENGEELKDRPNPFRSQKNYESLSEIPSKPIYTCVISSKQGSAIKEYNKNNKKYVTDSTKFLSNNQYVTCTGSLDKEAE